MTAPTKVLLVSGSLRAASVNSAVLRTAASLAGDGVPTTLFTGMGGLPHFNPDDDQDGGPVPTAVADLRRRLAEALVPEVLVVMRVSTTRAACRAPRRPAPTRRRSGADGPRA
jgi:NADPH-dependent FMN reductase